MRKSTLLSLLMVCLIITPSLAEEIPAEQRIHLGDVIQYGQNITYLNADVIPRDDQQTFRVVDEGTDPIPDSFGTYLGGPIIYPISQYPGEYYGCPNIPIHTNKDIQKYCLKLFTVMPAPRVSANLTVNSTPENAYVFLDGNLIGLSPRTILDVSNGNHTLIIRQDGYQDFNSIIVVNSTDQTVNTKLEINQALSPTPTNISTTISTILPTTQTAVPSQEITKSPSPTSPSNETSPIRNLVDSLMKFFGL